MNYKDLPKEQKATFDKLAEKVNDNKLVLMYMMMYNDTKCVHCNKEFPEGIMRKGMPAEMLTDAMYMFSTDYLVHCQQTHGYAPDTLTGIMKKFSETLTPDFLLNKPGT